ncbi:MAG: tetratricopeptide repeat protein [Deltaproteobacteria bacterium]|nr:tetratricopeptide repeat protein [Deltaproteobacteria bacterium]
MNVLIFPFLLFLSCTPPQSMIKDSLDKGNLYFEKGWHEQAILSYSKLITTLKNKSDPNLATAYYNRGLAYLMTRDYDKAILDFTSVIRLNPEDAQAYHCRGTIWHRKQCNDKAVNDFNRAIEKDPHTTESYYALGMIYFKQNNYGKTVEILSKAIAINPNFAKAYNGRGHAYMQSGMITKAILDFRKACDLGEQCGCIMLDLIAEETRQLTYND